MEDNIEDFLKNNALCVEQTRVCSMKCKMENLNVNLEQAANYLIRMFYQTGQKYSCTRTKIGKLLSIVAFVYAKKDRRIFNETIYKYGDCGTTINELTATVDRDVYLQCEYQNDGNYINDQFDASALIPDKHKNISSIEKDVAIVLENVFRHFGSYSAYELGQFICPIIEASNMILENNVVNLPQLCKLEYKDFEVSENNHNLLKYLFEHVN